MMDDTRRALLGDREAAKQPMNIAYNMDCMEYMRTLPEKAFDLAVVDPPYGIGRFKIAAYDAGLDFVGCEIDKDYFEAQEQRFQAHAAQENLFLDTRAAVLSAKEMEMLNGKENP